MANSLLCLPEDEEDHGEESKNCRYRQNNVDGKVIEVLPVDVLDQIDWSLTHSPKQGNFGNWSFLNLWLVLEFNIIIEELDSLFHRFVTFSLFFGLSTIAFPIILNGFPGAFPIIFNGNPGAFPIILNGLPGAFPKILNVFPVAIAGVIGAAVIGAAVSTVAVSAVAVSATVVSSRVSATAVSTTAISATAVSAAAVSAVAVSTTSVRLHGF